VNGRRFEVKVFGADREQAPERGNGRRAPARQPHRAGPSAPADGVMSALQGTVAAVMAESGQEVAAGQVLFIVEAMKMENEVAAPHAGRLGEVRVQVGQQVDSGMLLATFAP
jgi:acetyl-CoA/propionyl-CoA carboxylase biotin carboxyl carrier protein